MSILKRLQVIKQSLTAFIKPKISNCLFIVGLSIIAYGVWLIYPPAGIICAGLFLVFIAWLLS